MSDKEANKLIADLRTRTIDLGLMTEQRNSRDEKIKSLNILLANEKSIVKRREAEISNQLDIIHILKSRNLWQRIRNK